MIPISHFSYKKKSSRLAREAEWQPLEKCLRFLECSYCTVLYSTTVCLIFAEQSSFLLSHWHITEDQLQLAISDLQPLSLESSPSLLGPASCQCM